MTTKAPKPTRVNWIDWVPIEGREAALAEAEPLMTRDELVVALHEAGEEATAGDLNYWHRRRILPFPTRRADGHKVMAVYPQWFVWLVRRLRRYQREGLTLQKIGPALQILAEYQFVERPVSPERQRRIERAAQKRAYIEAIRDLTPGIRKLARATQELKGHALTRAEVRLYAEDETGWVIPISLDPNTPPVLVALGLSIEDHQGDVVPNQHGTKP
jgi:DNA-binding transcriptional MerR regulator